MGTNLTITGTTINASGGGEKRLFQYFVDINSNSLGIDVDAYTSAVAANTMTANGDTIEAEYAGLAEKNTNNKAVRARFAGTTIFDSGAIVNNNFADWRLSVLIIRESNTAARVSAVLKSGIQTFASYTRISTGLDFTTSEDLVLVIQADVSDTDNIAKFGMVNYVKAA